MDAVRVADPTQSIRSRLLADVQEERLELPTLPESNARLGRILENDVVELQQLIRALAKDPGVASQLIRIANSAPFGGPHPVGSIGVAIKQLGLQYAAELAAGLSNRHVFQPTNEMIERQYRVAIADATFVGATAAVFARNYTELSAERARTAGLMHNLGVFPILAQAEYENFTDTFALAKIVDAVQVVLSSLILKRWNFPKDVVDIPRQISGYARSNEEPELLDLVVAAMQLNHYFNHDDPEGPGDAAGRVGRSKMRPTLSMLIYQIAGFDPSSNVELVAALRREIENEIAESTD